jgi:hypothetical protein
MKSVMEDRLEIQELITRYNHYIDYADYPAWIDCFTDDGIFEGGAGRFVGRSGLKEFTEKFSIIRLDLPNMRHCLMNTLTEVDGDEARSSSYLLLVTTGAEGAQIKFAGRYDDRLVKLNGKWLFSYRKSSRDAFPVK